MEATSSHHPSQVASATTVAPEKENSQANATDSLPPLAGSAMAGASRAAQQREIALSKLQARSRKNPVLGDVFKEVI
jgi:hypothetical protein